jgi:alkylation response protein AidB-like acyl-CoA dehydrogenase
VRSPRKRRSSSSTAGRKDQIGAFLVPAGHGAADRREGRTSAAHAAPTRSRSDCRFGRRLGGDAAPLLRRAAWRSPPAVGVAEASLDYAINYANRDAFGSRSRKQAIAFMLADMAIEDAMRC